MNIKRIEERLTIEDFKDVIPEKNKEKITEFINKNIINNVLYAITGKIKQDGRYDLVYSNDLIKLCKPYLKENEEFFNDKTKECLKNIKNICIDVDEDDDSSEYIDQKVEKDEIKYIEIVPTYMSYDKFSIKIGQEANLKEWEIKSQIYEVIESFYRSLDYDGEIQIGGYVIWPIQYGYDNLIGYYDGGYGDCGALYVYLDNNKITSTIDMH